MSHKYYAVNNVVYDESGKVMVTICAVTFLDWVAAKMAEQLAEWWTEYEYDSRDIIKGSLH